jgi:hypothetical protein
LNELKRRGWSRGLVDRLLGPSDWSAPNPYHPGKAPMQLYSVARVEAAEASKEFRHWHAAYRAGPPPDKEPL